MKDSDIGWIAGIIDGEGTIALNKGRTLKNTHPCIRGFVWTPRVTIANNSKKIVDRVIELAGGIAFLRPTRPTGNQKAGYCVFFRRDETINLLKTIKDHLVGKTRQSELLLEFYDLIINYKGDRKSGVAERTALRDKRIETIYWELRLLNNKGIDGEQKVRDEMKMENFQPFSREQFNAQVVEIQKRIDEVAYGRSLARAKGWKSRHRDEMHAYWKEWYPKNKDKVKANYELKREEKMAYQREHYQKNKTKLAQYARAWREKNPEKAREIWRRSNERRRSQSFSSA